MFHIRHGVELEDIHILEASRGFIKGKFSLRFYHQQGCIVWTGLALVSVAIAR